MGWDGRVYLTEYQLVFVERLKMMETALMRLENGSNFVNVDF